jgi:hypothetical protein
MLIDLKSIVYPLFSLSELPDRFLGFNLSLLGHPFDKLILYFENYLKLIKKDVCQQDNIM